MPALVTSKMYMNMASIGGDVTNPKYWIASVVLFCSCCCSK